MVIGASLFRQKMPHLFMLTEAFHANTQTLPRLVTVLVWDTCVYKLLLYFSGLNIDLSDLFDHPLRNCMILKPSS
jgi:hypothetical protein